MEQAEFSVVTDRHNGIPSTNGPRLGTLKHSNSKVITPAFMFYTKCGSVPYISREVFEKIVPDDQVLFNFPLPTCLSFHQPLKEFKRGLNAFVGLEKYLSCCSITDCAVDNPQGYNKKDSVAIKTKSGNQLINYGKYMDIIEVFKPTMYVTLSISDINLDSSPSAIEKSVNISNRLFKSCLERHHQSEVLKQSCMIAPIQGGYNVQERIRSATFLSEYHDDVIGFLFDGFFTDGSIVEEIPSDLILPIVNKTMECLPYDKMKIIFGAWTPSLIIDFINSGVDMFDSSFPYITTERNSALIFDYSLKYKNESIIMDILNHKTDENVDSSNDYEICLTDTSHFEKFVPIKDSCTCLTCKKHTRSYIHHLLVSNELLGSILLTIHNLHYFNQFFKDIREVLMKK
ncbi:queuine tRNA-ribosyltransferase accessory subunit 2 [Rhopalosiphum padi]|uniref:queuine tRNA-ribosyltransferase accessory subunit 2 n=1 Tax=Rhopalosiphum padi TaxID=40932 RepID=UPI00298E06C1|nr:queuine tRNA-ribosyltransferase accessory subunit 2 [Rhopalosiphum padi]